MDEQRFRTGLGSEAVCTKLYNPRWPHSPEKHKLEMDVGVERLRLEILISQPAPSPQDGPSPRWSPVVGTGSDEPGVSRAETQSTERERNCPLQASVDGFLHICTSPEWTAIILLQADVGTNVEKTTNSEQAAAREEFARPSKKRQQQRMTACSKDPTKQFDPGG